jgi:hypothetical protein
MIVFLEFALLCFVHRTSTRQTTQEATLPKSHPARRRLPAALGVLTIAIGVSVLGPSLVQANGTAHVAAGATGATGTTSATGSTGTTGATTPVTEDPNNYTCSGHIEKGDAEPGVTGTQVKYEFYCDGPITGYSIETEPHQIQFFDQSPLVSLNGVSPLTDSFSCNGFVPGIQINCIGLASGTLELITGQFVIAGKSICTEPRVDPLLTVTQATATTTIGGTKTAPTATAIVTQAMSGPFDLGRPHGCKGDPFGRNMRLGSHPPKVILGG